MCIRDSQWSVYVLVKVSHESVTKHRAAIAEERKLAESAPPPPDKWVASVYNIDDSVSVYVNGTKVNQCDFSRSCEIRLTPHFRLGINKVKLVYQNDLGFWAYGYEILKNDEVMYKGRCGQVWFMAVDSWIRRSAWCMSLNSRLTGRVRDKGPRCLFDPLPKPRRFHSSTASLSCRDRAYR